MVCDCSRSLSDTAGSSVSALNKVRREKGEGRREKCRDQEIGGNGALAKNRTWTSAFGGLRDIRFTTRASVRPTHIACGADGQFQRWMVPHRAW